MIATLLALAIAAQEAPATPPIVVEGERPAEQKKVCRNVRETGSHMFKRVCRSAVDQKQIDTQARNTLKLGNRSPDPPDAFVPPTPE